MGGRVGREVRAREGYRFSSLVKLKKKEKLRCLTSPAIFFLCSSLLHRKKKNALLESLLLGVCVFITAGPVNTFFSI
jgi:hypothetical protein